MASDGFEIYLDFKKSEGDPSRVFHAMGDVIDSLQELDSDLARIISPFYQPTLVLDNVESGSIKAKIRDVVKDIPDDAIKESSIKKILGHFLLKSKYQVLKWCEDKSSIENIEDIRELEGTLVKIAEDTEAKHIPAYSSIETKQLRFFVD